MCFTLTTMTWTHSAGTGETNITIILLLSLLVGAGAAVVAGWEHIETLQLPLPDHLKHTFTFNPKRWRGTAKSFTE